MHFFHHHHNKKDTRITEDNDLLQRRVNELDAENANLRGGEEEIIVREDIAKNAHLMNAPVSGGTEVFEEESISIKRRSGSSSANDLALGESEAHTLRAGQTARIVSAAAAAQGGAGSSGSLASAASSTSTASSAKVTTVRRVMSKEPPRVIHAEIIRPEKHILKESSCTTEKACAAAKDGDVVEEIDVRRESVDAKTGDLVEEELTIKALEREVKKPEIKTETHVNYVPMGRPKAHERLSPAPASEVVDHLNNNLSFQVDAHEIGSHGTPLHKETAFPLPESMTKLPKGLDADKARLKTFERDVELSHQERLVKRNAIIEGVLNANGQEQTFEEELEFQKIVHQL